MFRHRYSVILLFSIIILMTASYLLSDENQSSEWENRTLSNFSMVFNPPSENSVVYKENTLERLEDALKDQFIIRRPIIYGYIAATDLLSNVTSNLMLMFDGKPIGENQYTYDTIGNYIRVSGTDWISSVPVLTDIDSNSIKIHTEQIEHLHEMYSNIHFYFYFVTQARDTGWFDEFLKVKSADGYTDICNEIPEYVRTMKFKYNDLQDYQNIHYASDHHWNEEGSRRGYEDIYNMITEEQRLSPLRCPKAKIEFSRQLEFRYRGSYAKRLQDLYNGSDDFFVYKYDLPERKIYAVEPGTGIETELEELGLWEEYENGEVSKDKYADHYITFYGYGRDKKGKKYADSDYMFIIENSESSSHNLLICGESYCRAFRDVLASHFGTTIYLDYRIMSDVDIDTIIDMYDIDTIVLGGNTTMWSEEEFVFTFSSDEEERR